MRAFSEVTGTSAPHSLGTHVNGLSGAAGEAAQPLVGQALGPGDGG